MVGCTPGRDREPGQSPGRLGFRPDGYALNCLSSSTCLLTLRVFLPHFLGLPRASESWVQQKACYLNFMVG